MKNKELCLALTSADSEKEVFDLLKESGHWDDESAWRDYGDQENNFPIISNQANDPVQALVEKLTNSTDQVLISQCIKEGIDPKGPDAPRSMRKATEQLLGIENGELKNLTTKERKQLSDKISIVATGTKSSPSYTIIDKGTGQTPETMPDTILSLNKSNKKNIPFTLGVYNQGGTAALMFCGTDHNLQLVVCKGDPEVTDQSDPSRKHWGFTVVRKFEPKSNERLSTFKYLAPEGNILRFEADALPLRLGETDQAFLDNMEFGTIIKLYDYQLVPKALKSVITLDLYYKLSALLPDCALPVRIHETRDYRGHTLETSLTGLSCRIKDNAEKVLEGDPFGGIITIEGQSIPYEICVFKKGDAKKRFKGDESIVFTLNGQRQHYLPNSFLTRKTLKRIRLISKDILMKIDCSYLGPNRMETFFMASRDRVRHNKFYDALIIEVESVLRNHVGLQEIAKRRFEEEVKDKFDDDEMMKNIISQLIKIDSGVASLFIEGLDITNPPSPRSTVVEGSDYQGNKFPSYWELDREFPSESPKIAMKGNSRFQVQFRTDVENDYFTRSVDSGELSLFCEGEPVANSSINCYNGIATLNIEVPSDVATGEMLTFASEVNDIANPLPFESDFHVKLNNGSNNGNGTGTRRRPIENGFKIPTIIEVYEGDDKCKSLEFDGSSSMAVNDAGEDGLILYCYMDNKFLLNAVRRSPSKAALLKKKYQTAMTLITIAIIKEYKDKKVDGISDDFEKHVLRTTSAVSRVIFPIMENLSALSLD